jgi:AcrR family transcriptional regulator
MSAEARREVIEQAATELFAERGYRGAAMSAIAERAGITVPVLYDHFSSKEDLHRHLLERGYAALGAIWAEHLGVRGDHADVRIRRGVEAWFAYVDEHPAAARMLFRAGGDEHAEQVRLDVAAASQATVMPLLGREEGLAPSGDDLMTLELIWELVRGAMQSLALWWLDHPDVPRERVVESTLAVLWNGLS